MSVINQMLVDLERRRASGEERNRIPDHVRVLPGDAQAARLSTLRVAAPAVLVLIAAGAWWWTASRAPMPVAAPTTAPAAAVVSPSAPPERQQEAVELIARRLSLELAQVPADPPPAPAAAERDVVPAIATASIIPSRSAAVAPPEPPRAAPAPERKKAAAAAQVQPAPRAAIDKQVRQPSPRQRAEAEYARGAAVLYQGQPGDARAAFEAALQIDPTYHGARQALVGVLLDARRQAEAVELLQEGLRLAPAQHGFAMALARLQVERDELDAAAQTLLRSLDYPGVGPDYIAFYAGLLQRQQKHAEAVAQFQRALGQRGNVGIWLLGMGVSLDALGRGADAQEAYRRAKDSGNLSAELQGVVDQRLR
jgi:MSHA biogenesis protein MshN